MKNKWFLFGLVLSVAINVGVFGGAGYRFIKKSSAANCAEKNLGSSFERFARDVGLSPTQAQEFDALRKSFEPQTSRIRDSLKEKRTRLVDKLMEPDANLEKLMAEVNEIESLQAELQKLAVDQMLKEKALLTPDQKKKFFSLISNRLCPEGRHPIGEIPSMAGREEGGCLK